MGLFDFGWVSIILVLGISVFLFSQFTNALGLTTGVWPTVVSAVMVLFAVFSIYFIYHFIFERNTVGG